MCYYDRHRLFVKHVLYISRGHSNFVDIGIPRIPVLRYTFNCCYYIKLFFVFPSIFIDVIPHSFQFSHRLFPIWSPRADLHWSQHVRKDVALYAFRNGPKLDQHRIDAVPVLVHYGMSTMRLLFNPNTNLPLDGSVRLGNSATYLPHTRYMLGHVHWSKVIIITVTS